jgi:hypothetical protein
VIEPIGGRKTLQVRPGHQFGIHAAGLLEQRAAQVVLAGAEALGDARQMPDRVDRDLGDADVAGFVQDVAVGREPVCRHRGLDFGQIEPRLGDGDGRADIDALADPLAEILRDAMAERIERDDPAGREPLRLRRDLGSRDGCW